MMLWLQLCKGAPAHFERREPAKTLPPANLAADYFQNPNKQTESKRGFAV